MSSSRNSFKNDEKKRFRKVNEEFLKNKGKNQVFNTDFQKKKKKTDIKLKSPVIGAVKKKIVPEEFSKEINETLDIFNQIRSQIKGKNTSKSSKRPIEANFKPNFKRNNSNIIKKNESTRKTSKHVEKKLNSIGKIDYDSRKTKEKFGGTVRNEKKEEKFSKKIIDLYKEDIKCNKIDKL